jgi:hypothetical protein
MQHKHKHATSRNARKHFQDSDIIKELLDYLYKKRVDVLLNATTRRDVNGRVVGVIGVGQEIIEHKYDEDRLEVLLNERWRDSVELEMTRVAKELQTFIDTVNAPIFGIDDIGLVRRPSLRQFQIFLSGVHGRTITLEVTWDDTVEAVFN